MSLPLRRAVARRYRIDDGLHLDPIALRKLARALSRAGAGERDPDTEAESGAHGPLVHSGELHALLVLHDVLAGTVAQGLEPMVVERIEAEVGADRVAAVLATFEGEFESGSADEDASRHRRQLLKELLMVWLLNQNPALGGLREIFDDASLLELPEYREVATSLAQSLAAGAEEPKLDPVAQMRELISVAPDSIRGQLRHLLQTTTGLESEERDRVLRVLDTLAEEEVRPPPGPGPVQPPALGTAASNPDPLPARHEAAWMSRAAVVAKNARVWLHQLSTSSGRPITRLDQVPADEIRALRQRGLDCLWLIGVWERSPASAAIKHRSGLPHAAASAYSIFDYRVSADLGGDAAMDGLIETARECGVRIGVDVVPNHMGIDSVWVREHPDWFVGCDESPFPSYTFNGPDLSGDPRFGLYLEDHYYDATDAAVVFLRRDRESGEERFLYHGNDGTSTPWNDTAQLDYTRREVRQAMTVLILSLASRFPLLRFDAAMTLTRRHFQRLWYPAPGDGGAVPSRSAHGLGREDFARRMPVEFWRQVCDAAAEECPDTLLVAEAFWLMEGYFVREIGMGRVYNSAFMRLLHEGRNASFMSMLRDTIGVDPRILGRYVNFLTNPDEATAVEQFGRGDRYFGACTVLATLPGLPLFGHGQVGGLEERYGMDFERGLLAEAEDPAMVERHLDEIAPLLEQRERFSRCDRLGCLQLVGEDGRVNEDVLAWRGGGEREPALVVFNHSATAASGRLRSDPLAASGGVGLLPFGTPLNEGEVLVCEEERSGQRFEWPACEAARLGLSLTLKPFQAMVLGRVEN